MRLPKFRFRKPRNEPETAIVYGGPRYRIYTTGPTSWQVQQYVFGQRWTAVREPPTHFEVLAGFSAFGRQVARQTKQECKDWIDNEIREWIAEERGRLEAVEYQKNNPPEEYP